jgi:hypothetical protein
MRCHWGLFLAGPFLQRGVFPQGVLGGDDPSCCPICNLIQPDRTRSKGRMACDLEHLQGFMQVTVLTLVDRGDVCPGLG